MTPESVNTNEKKYLTSLKVLTVQRLRYLKKKKGMTLVWLDWSNSWGPPSFVHTLWSFCVKRQVYISICLDITVDVQQRKFVQSTDLLWCVTVEQEQWILTIWCSISWRSLFEIITTRQSKGRIYPPDVVFKKKNVFLNLTGRLKVTKSVHYHWSRVGQ